MLAFASCISIRCPPPLTSPGWSGRPRRERVASEPVCEAAPPTPAPAVPTSLQALTTLAAKSVSEALKDGEKRIRITALPPTLNPVLENSFPYSAQNLHILVRDILLQTPVETSKTSILFASAGQAASAKAQYKKEISVFAKLEDEEDDEIAIASYYRRDFYEGRTKDVNFIVSPVSNRGDSVMDDLDTILSEAPDAVWVLVNAALTLDRAAVGMSENKRRQDFLESFTEVFYFRNLVRHLYNGLKPLSNAPWNIAD